MNFPSLIAAAALASLALIASSPARADTAPAQAVLGLSASASVEVTKDLLSVTFSANKEGADANAVQALLKLALEYAKQFGYGGFAIREVNVATSEPQQGPIPMLRRQAATASSQGDALSVEPGKALVTATVNGTVQMK